MPNRKYVHKPESEFLIGQAEYSQSYEHLQLCLATECSLMIEVYM